MLLVCRRSFHLEMSGKRQGEVMNLQIKTINNVLFVSLVVSIFGLVAMYLNYTQQSDQIEQLRGQLIEKENQIVISNEALSYTRYQHQLLAEDYSRFRDEQSISRVLR
ncbi:hypothetical protein CGG82_20445 [Vibrio parahaemolyticus]|nr:hypothetical protein [Vibrio parahaemolyticus]TOR10730.1 hypothetical protein CGG82_20445 [Vibrio parahaemolyticus]WCZ08280.1 hypothetical protein GSR97_18625 [Vibrio parahaemolyticus]WCZ13767.1 hypothetical protein GSS20_20895 [Vibrio parahaemolyticus]